MTKIQWTEETWNPIVGCSIVSPGCTNCYAMKTAWRMGHNPSTPQYHGLTKKVNGNAVWNGKMALAEKALLKPLKRKKPTMYFVNSMGDLFHENVPDQWIDKVFAVMALCPQHTFQVLTKRADRMREYLTQSTQERWFQIDQRAMKLSDQLKDRPLPTYAHRMLSNVWLGVSVEDQTRADERIPLLLDTPAAVRFVSVEPLLGAVDLHGWLYEVLDVRKAGLSDDPMAASMLAESIANGCASAPMRPPIDWVICGGESGKDARAMHPAWASSLRDQCVDAGVPFFFKQWGEWLPGEFGSPPDVNFQDGSWMDINTLPDIDVDKDWCEDWATAEFEAHVIFKRVGKKTAGNILDGKEWQQMPEVVA